MAFLGGIFGGFGGGGGRNSGVGSISPVGRNDGRSGPRGAADATGGSGRDKGGASVLGGLGASDYGGGGGGRPEDVKPSDPNATPPSTDTGRGRNADGGNTAVTGTGDTGSTPGRNPNLPADPVQARRGERRPDRSLLDAVQGSGNRGRGNTGNYRGSILSAVYRLPEDGTRAARTLQSFNGPRGQRGGFRLGQ